LVSGNLQQLQQVMMNLISNARHALKEKQQREPGSAKVLEIRGEEVTEQGRPLVRISVRDNGTGIPAALIERVTEPFFTTKSSELGTGLGLSISRKILDDHQGRLTVESIEGQYTTISIELPAAKVSGLEL
jgi:signal transduction histidine kinase